MLRVSQELQESVVVSCLTGPAGVLLFRVSQDLQESVVFCVSQDLQESAEQLRSLEDEYKDALSQLASKQQQIEQLQEVTHAVHTQPSPSPLGAHKFTPRCLEI